jgi:hypothetical protein
VDAKFAHNIGPHSLGHSGEVFLVAASPFEPKFQKIKRRKRYLRDNLTVGFISSGGDAFAAGHNPIYNCKKSISGCKPTTGL